MAMQTDVKSTHTTISGLVVPYRTRLKGIVCLSGGTAGEVVIRNGSASADVVFQFNVPTSTIAEVFYNLPGEGILATVGLYVVLPTGAEISLVYG
tara:strand:+ start:677 stop:961 length:285 start_codon:yes stop_codon:yes gene_type:complete